MIGMGQRAAVIACEGCDRFNFVGGKSGKIAMLDEVIGMLMVLADINHIADVMENGRIFQPFALLRIEVRERSAASSRSAPPRSASR